MAENYGFDEEVHGDLGFDLDEDNDEEQDPYEGQLLYNPETGEYEPRD